MKGGSHERLYNHKKIKTLEQLIDKYSSYVVVIASRIGGSILKAQDIEEIASDVFFSIWKNRHSLIETESIKPYIAQIARNMTRKKLLTCKTSEPLEDDILVAPGHDIAEELYLQEKVTYIHNLFEEFKSPDRDILISYYFDNYKLEEIATNLEIPLSTVKSKLYRGRKEVVKAYEKGGFNEI